MEEKLTEEQKELELEQLLEIVKLVAPGTKLRTAIDDIVRSGLGALIVLGDSPEVLNCINGGFKIDCKFSPRRLVELCKMDGAIILSNDGQKILYCNTLLVPDTRIETSETGMRHIAAERTAKQTSRPVIAISERAHTVTLYYKNSKYVLKRSEELLSKAAEALRMLEKHKEVLDELLIKLSLLEFAGLVSLQDVIPCIQRAELIARIAETIRNYIIQLGAEGTLISISLKEVTKDFKEQELLLKDYSRDWMYTKTALSTLTFDELLEPEQLMRTLLYSSMSDSISPRGYRILAKTSLSEAAITTLTNSLTFPELVELVLQNNEKLVNLIGEKEASKLSRELGTLREQLLAGKKI